MPTHLNTAIIVAGGKGRRMGSATKKQYLLLEGVPVLTRTLSVFDRCPLIDHIVLVVPEQDIAFCREQIITGANFGHDVHLTCGGAQRQDSVFNGLRYLADQLAIQKHDIVLVHDGVRPFVSLDLIERSIDTAVIKKACIPGLPITDTVKRIDNAHHIVETVDRQELFTVQTPQAFQFGVLWEAYQYARKTKFSSTDDASVVEYFGQTVSIVQGEKHNIKLTTPEDLDYAKYFLQKSDSYE